MKRVLTLAAAAALLTEVQVGAPPIGARTTFRMDAAPILRTEVASIPSDLRDAPADRPRRNLKKAAAKKRPKPRALAPR